MSLQVRTTDWRRIVNSNTKGRHKMGRPKGSKNRDYMAADVAEADVPKIEGVRMETDTFRITVKDDEGEELYKNDEEPFAFPVIENLPALFAYLGGQAETDKLASSLPGENNGKAVAKLLEQFNASEKARYQRNAYAKLLNEKRPPTEENILNAHARTVRSVMKTKQWGDEATIEALKTLELLPADYTVAQFRANKSKV